MKNSVVAENDIPTLSKELNNLRGVLEMKVEGVAALRQRYDAECRKVSLGNDADIVMAKQTLDLATDRIESIRVEIAEKERLLDEAQGREADENRRREARQNLEQSCRRLAESQAELAKLRSEYRALPDKIRIAEWHFHEALRAFTLVKEANTGATAG